MKFWGRQEAPVTKQLRQVQKYQAYKRAHQEVLVDVDGTLSEWSYPELGLPTQGSRGAMIALRKLGLRVVIWSSRFDPGINTAEELAVEAVKVKNWLDAHQFQYDEIDLGCRGKRCASAYIDDRAVGFRGDWGQVLAEILELRANEAKRLERTRREYVDSGFGSRADGDGTGTA